MDDLISRQALMKEFSDFVRASNNSDFAQTPTWNDAVLLVESMPSAQQWIPCSERLPERNGAYLVWMQWPCDEEPTAFIINYDADCEMFGEWLERYDPITLGYLNSDFEEIKGVIAWMPLPKPYKEEQDG